MVPRRFSLKISFVTSERGPRPFVDGRFRIRFPAEIDEGRLGDDVVFLDESPESTVVTVVTIVPDHKVMARRNRDRAIVVSDAVG